MRRALVIIAVLALTGCASAEPPASLSSAEAIDRYQPLFDGLSSDIETAYPGHLYAVDNVHDLVDAEGCILWIGDLENNTTDADDRDDYLAIIRPQASTAGFSSLTQLDTDEGVPFEPAFVATDDAGTRLRVTFENPGFSLSIVANVTDSRCSA